jgi:hypothetical protein
MQEKACVVDWQNDNRRGWAAAPPPPASQCQSSVVVVGARLVVMEPPPPRPHTIIMQRRTLTLAVIRSDPLRVILWSTLDQRDCDPPTRSGRCRGSCESEKPGVLSQRDNNHRGQRRRGCLACFTKYHIIQRARTIKLIDQMPVPLRSGDRIVDKFSSFEK